MPLTIRRRRKDAPDLYDIETFECPEHPLPDDTLRFRADCPEDVAALREVGLFTGLDTSNRTK